MVLGKHNYVVSFAANQMARKLGNTLVAPVIQYVPEGDPDRQGPGSISLPSLERSARSLSLSASLPNAFWTSTLMTTARLRSTGAFIGLKGPYRHGRANDAWVAAT